MQNPEKRRDSTSSRLKKIWKPSKRNSSGLSSDSGGEGSSRRESKCSISSQPQQQSQQQQQQPQSNNHNKPPACSLPLLQIWPANIDSPRSEPDGQSFIFSGLTDDNNLRQLDTTAFIEQSSTSSPSSHRRESLITIEHGGDSGIESVQASPSPIGQQSNQSSIIMTSSSALKSFSVNSPTPSERQQKQQRFTKLLHPDHARIIRPITSPDSSIEDNNDLNNGNLCTASSSTTSSLTSIAAAVRESNTSQFRLSDPWLHRQSTQSNHNDEENAIPGGGQRRKSTGRYSLLDALDLEYALLRAAARGSVGPYSLSESLHKLTFTQSLAFPALARSITSKRRRSEEHTQQRPLDPNESSFNLLAKFVTACVLVLISFLVFLIVYKFSVT